MSIYDLIIVLQALAQGSTTTEAVRIITDRLGKLCKEMDERVRDLEAQVVALHKEVDRLGRHATDGRHWHVRVSRGTVAVNKIHLIKALRGTFALTLKEAKEMVERMEVPGPDPEVPINMTAGEAVGFLYDLQKCGFLPGVVGLNYCVQQTIPVPPGDGG